MALSDRLPSGESRRRRRRRSGHRRRPGAGSDTEPSVAALRAEILEKVANYARRRWTPQTYVPGKTPAPYAGRVFDEEEVVSLVDASLDFWLTSGRFCRQLEKGLAEFVGVAECRLVNSGSSANLLAFSTLTSPRLGDRRIRPGDELITVAAGFPTTVAPAIQHGVVPVFVDVDPVTDNIDTSMLARGAEPAHQGRHGGPHAGESFRHRRRPRTSAKPMVCGWSRTTATAWAPNTPPDVEGRAETRRTGTFGHLATSSFYPAHQMTTGEGGAVYTSDDELASIAESIRDWGRDCYCQPGRSNTCGKRFGWSLGTLPGGLRPQVHVLTFWLQPQDDGHAGRRGRRPAEEASLIRSGTSTKFRLPPPAAGVGSARSCAFRSPPHTRRPVGSGFLSW